MNLVSELDLPVFDYSAPDFSADRYHQQLAETRQRGWLAKSPLAYIVLDHDAGEFFLRSRKTAFPGRQLAEFFGVTSGPLAEHIDANILNLGGEQHRRLRALVGPALTPRAADRWRPVMRGFLEQLWAQPAGHGGCDFVAAVARPYPSLTIATVLGAPHQHAEQLHTWSSWVQRQFDIRALEMNRDDIERAVTEVRDYVTGLLEAKRAAPGDDLISDLLAARDEGDRLSAEECVQLVTNLLAGGIDTTAGQLAHAIRLFAARPGQWALLAAEPSLVPRAVEEVLRFEPVRRLPHGSAWSRSSTAASCSRRGRSWRSARSGPTARARTARSSTSPRRARAGCSPSARASTTAWARTWPGPSSRRHWRSSRRARQDWPWTGRRSWAGSRASTGSTSSRSPGRIHPR
jgi:cytochrome P450